MAKAKNIKKPVAHTESTTTEAPKKKFHFWGSFYYFSLILLFFAIAYGFYVLTVDYI